VLSGEATHTNCIVFGFNPLSTALDTSTLIISPPIQLVKVMLVSRHFQQYLSYIVAVIFIGGGNRSTQRKNTDFPQVTGKRLLV
jgi:hypothetical protein